MFGALPSRIARCSTGSASPSISRKTIPGASRLDALLRPSRDAVDHAERVEVVVVDAEEHAERDAGRRGDERDAERRPEAVDVEVAARDRVGGEQHRRVEHEHEQEADERHQRQAQRRDDRRQQRVEDADHGGRGERAPDVVHRGAGDHRRADDERDRREQPRDEQMQRRRCAAASGSRPASRRMPCLLVVISGQTLRARKLAAWPTG